MTAGIVDPVATSAQTIGVTAVRPKASDHLERIHRVMLVVVVHARAADMVIHPVLVSPRGKNASIYLSIYPSFQTETGWVRWCVNFMR